MRYGFGVDLGGTTVKIAYFDETGAMLAKWEIPTVTEGGGSEILPDIAASIRQFIDQKDINRADIIGVGIGVPGPVDGKGVVNKCVNLGWGVFNIAESLSALVGFPVKAGNDANVAALGEYWKGGGKGAENMIFATLGTGVGGGIVIGGHLLHGAHGSGAEIGHLVLNREETEKCNCGKRGCVEQYCSATGIVRMARKALETSNAYSTLRQHNPLTCKDIFDCGKAGDYLATQVLDQYYAYLGEFLANLCDVIDPEAVVLGGGVSKAGQMLLDGVRPHFDRNIFHAARGARFALASLGNDAGAYGAFKLALDAFG
ncbi:MAG: ROK family glucokinase [Oscillospiraceae bacterium]|nr:ROK family glucokinase [Oscillospiraceae bacterium]